MLREPDPVTPLILVVDDNEASRSKTTHALNKAGYSVIEAVDGDSALSQARICAPDLIVLGIKSGAGLYDVCRQIKSDNSLSSTMVLMLSENSVTPQDKVQAIEEGADAFLAQPVETIELLATIKALLRLHAAEAKARLGEREFRMMADSIPQMAWMTDSRGAVFWFNQRWYDYVGTTLEEVKGWGWQKMLHPEHAGRVVEKYKDAVQREENWEDVYPLRSRHGEYRWFLSRAFPVRDEKSVVQRWLGTNTDITEQLKTEKDLIDAKNKAEAANIAKSEFLANMSHEIRTPMNAVIGLSNILGASEPLTSRQKEYVGTLQASAQSLLNLMNDLLDIAKLESKNVTLESIPFNLKNFAQGVINIMMVKATEKNIQLKLELEGDFSQDVVSDPLRLQQILLNLVSNGIKFTDKGEVVLNMARLADKVVFAVKDTGCGIARDNLDAIFSKFTQGNSSVSRAHGGTGLGLAIAKSLTKIMGGEIDVESNLGSGSVFTVTLPLRFMTPEGEVGSSQDEDGAKSFFAEVRQPLILLVEDYKPNVLVAEHILEQLGYRHEVAQNGQEALDKLQEPRFDLVLMDVQMPVMDGFTATRLFRAREKEKDWHRTPVIGITAFALSGDKEKCLSAGMDDYLSKPFNPDDLGEKLKVFLKK